MVRVITVDDIKTLIRKVTLETFLTRLVDKLEETYAHWSEFKKLPRIAAHFDPSVIELMPFWGKDYYAVKYITGYPNNPKQKKLTVAGVGILSDVATGYPVLISEMTVLTALRTAATSALAAKFLAKRKSKTFGIIGVGAQSEFQVMAHHVLFNLKTVKYFDIDTQAMEKFKKNLSGNTFELIACKNPEEVVQGADIITTATAAKGRTLVLKQEWIQPGMMINAMGGDAPGKGELEPQILSKAKVVVEFLEQTQQEGEIQYGGKIYAELGEIASGQKKGRTNDEEIFVYDSVGFALEDYTSLKLLYSLAEDFHIGHVLDLIPELKDPKNLFSELKS